MCILRDGLKMCASMWLAFSIRVHVLLGGVGLLASEDVQSLKRECDVMSQMRDEDEIK